MSDKCIGVFVWMLYTQGHDTWGTAIPFGLDNFTMQDVENIIAELRKRLTHACDVTAKVVAGD